MDANIIAFQAMLATKDSATYAFWATCASIFSTLITLATLGMAYTALDSWKEQERMKFKLSFKRAMLGLKYALDSMPNSWSYQSFKHAKQRVKIFPDLINHPEDDAQIYFRKCELVEAYNEATKEWIMCGHLFETTEIDNAWKDLANLFQNYIKMGGDKSPLMIYVNRICSDLKIL